jgi:hypothetical protein
VYSRQTGDILFENGLEEFNNHYETGKKISDEEMDHLNIKFDKVNPQWNYTIYRRTQREKVEK